MIKHWQSMQDYKCFFLNSKVSFDSSERTRLHTDLWIPWQKLHLFDTDIAMGVLLPFYSSTGRPAKNQPQILRSFILFFLLVSMGLSALILILWTASGSMPPRIFIPGRNFSPLPGIPPGLTGRMGSIRKLSKDPSTSRKGLSHVF